MPSISPEQRTEWRKLCDAATPGPWRADTVEPFDCVVWAGKKFLGNVGNDFLAPVGGVVMFDLDIQNANLIAAARTALPLLLDALDEAELDTKRIDKLDTLCVTVHDADGDLVMFRAPKASPLRRYIDDVIAADAEAREGER